MSTGENPTSLVDIVAKLRQDFNDQVERFEKQETKVANLTTAYNRLVFGQAGHEVVTELCTAVGGNKLQWKSAMYDQQKQWLQSNLGHPAMRAILCKHLHQATERDVLRALDRVLHAASRLKKSRVEFGHPYTTVDGEVVTADHLRQLLLDHPAANVSKDDLELIIRVLQESRGWQQWQSGM